MSEAQLAETRYQLGEKEKYLQGEQEKFWQLSVRHQELTAITQSADAKVKAKDEQANLLHVSVDLLWRSHMSLVMRKPVFCICKNKDADQLRGNREADQRLCFRYMDSTIPLLSKSEISSL